MTAPNCRWRRSVVLAAGVLVTACGGGAGRGGRPEPLPEQLRIHPASAAYQGVTHGYIEQSFAGQVTSNRFGMRYYLHTDVASDSGNASVQWVIDSLLPVPGAGGVTAQQADSARGAAYRGLLARTGELTDFAGGLDAGAPAAELAGRILRDFYPRLPGDGAQVGATWTDTVESDRTTNGVENVVRSVNTRTASGWVEQDGARALRIETVADYTFSGAGIQSGQRFTLEGTGRRHTVEFVGSDGQFLGFTGADTSEAEAQVTDMGIVIPVRQQRVDSLFIR